MLSVTSAVTPSRSSRSMLAESSPRSPQPPSVPYVSDAGSRKYSYLYCLFIAPNFESWIDVHACVHTHKCASINAHTKYTHALTCH